MEWLEGKPVAAELLASIKTEIKSLDFTPRLVFIRVGHDPASESYVRGKERAAKRVGIASETLVLPEDTTEEDLLEHIADINEDEDVDGLLVQFPVPEQINEQVVINSINPAKDVDGLHPVNVGRLWSGQAGQIPCTAAGLIAIMDYYKLPIEGKDVLIIGRSNLVGKPAAALFLARNATVTLAHSRTQNIAALSQQADVVVAAVGKRWMIDKDMVKEGAVLLDVGITRVDGELLGDINPNVEEKAGYLTPMPGGTGRMTVALLMQNTLDAAKRRRKHA